MILGFTGPARSGKDTAAEYILKWYSGFKRFAFADVMKGYVNNMFGWDERHSYGELKEVVDVEWGFSPRRAYQLFGTDFGRALSEDLWVMLACKAMDIRKHYVITDVRFENEARFVRECGFLFHVTTTRELPKVEAHVSEAGVAVAQGDFILRNDGSINEFHSALNDILHNYPLLQRMPMRDDPKPISQEGPTCPWNLINRA